MLCIITTTTSLAYLRQTKEATFVSLPTFCLQSTFNLNLYTTARCPVISLALSLSAVLLWRCCSWSDERESVVDSWRARSTACPRRQQRAAIGYLGHWDPRAAATSRLDDRMIVGGMADLFPPTPCLTPMSLCVTQQRNGRVSCLPRAVLLKLVWI